MNNTNYEHLYIKYENKYINLKKAIALQHGGVPNKTPQIKLEQGMCVKGHYIYEYKDRLARIYEVCENKKCKLVGNSNYITLTDGTTISITDFNKHYTVRTCPENDKDLYNDKGIFSVHVDKEGFFFNVGDKVINKKQVVDQLNQTKPIENIYRISKIYPVNDEVSIIIKNINKPSESEQEYDPNLLKKDYYIVHPEYNFVGYALADIEGMQNIVSRKNAKLV